MIKRGFLFNFLKTFAALGSILNVFIALHQVKSCVTVDFTNKQLTDTTKYKLNGTTNAVLEIFAILSQGHREHSFVTKELRSVHNRPNT